MRYMSLTGIHSHSIQTISPMLSKNGCHVSSKLKYSSPNVQPLMKETYFKLVKEAFNKSTVVLIFSSGNHRSDTKQIRQSSAL